MKIFISILILIFNLQSLAKADDISEFQIEGISLGDSLLDYMSEKEIIEDNPFYYKNNKYAIVTCLSKASIYDFVNCTYQPSDLKLKIYSIEGVILFNNKIDKCLKKRKSIEIELSNMFKNTKKYDFGTYNHAWDKSGKSKQTVTDFIFENGDSARVTCNDWSDKITKKYNYADELKVSITKGEFQKFIDNEAYN